MLLNHATSVGVMTLEVPFIEPHIFYTANFHPDNNDNADCYHKLF